MPVQFGNYISTTLIANITAAATSFAVTSVAGMPTPGSGYFFYITVIDQSSALAGRNPPAQREVMRVTGIVGTTLTVTRGVDGTAAQAFALGSVVEIRFNKAAADELMSRDGLNVKDFLAVGNGVADDTTPILQAMNAAAALGTGIYLPGGTYLTNPITPPANLAFIRGDGAGATTLFPTRQAYAANSVMVNLSGSARRCAVVGLTLDMQNAVFVGTRGFQLGGDGVSLTDVNIIGRANFGVISQAGTGARINGMRITAVGGSIDTGIFTQVASETQVEGVVITGNHNYGIVLGGGVFNSIRNCSSYAMAATGTEVFAFALSDCALSSISDCYSRDSRREAANLTNCLSSTISDCCFEWTGVNGTDFGISINGTVAGGGSKYNVVSGNTILNSYTTAIAVAGHSAYNTVSDNNCYECAWRIGGGAMLACFTQVAGDVNTNNRFTDNVVTNVTAGALTGFIEIQAGGSTIGVNLADRNTLVGCTTRYTLVSGSSQIVDHTWITWAPTVSNSAGGGVFTVQAARYQINGRGINFVFKCTVTNAGAGGFVSATLPFTPVALGGTANGIETAVVGDLIAGTITAAGIFQLRRPGTLPTCVLNYQLQVSGYYEAA